MTLRPEHIEEALNKKTFDEIDPDEVLKHYGYKPEEVHCNGVGIGVFRTKFLMRCRTIWKRRERRLRQRRRKSLLLARR